LRAFHELHANENQIAGNRSGLVREALDAVIALYALWGKPEQVAEWKAKLGDTRATSVQQEVHPRKKI
jgi:hypothetical protein